MEKINAVEATLKKAGFILSERCCSRPSCFDFAARRHEVLILARVQPDTEKISPSDYMELKAISECVSAASLLISEKSREKSLEDDTVYSRHEIQTINHKTFENVVLRKTYPLIRAGPGGYYVEINGKEIRQQRQKLGLSIGELAKTVGVSRRTLYGYEQGMTKASVSAAYNLMCVLGIPVAKPVDMFKEPEDRSCQFLTTAKEAIARNRILKRIFRRLASCSIVHVKKAPFDFLINFKEEVRIIGGVVDDEERELNRRVSEIMSFSKVVQAHPILVTDKQESLSEDILCVRAEELSRISRPEDLIENFT